MSEEEEHFDDSEELSLNPWPAKGRRISDDREESSGRIIAVGAGKKQMEQFDRLMDFVRETREIQQKYLETIRSENEKQIENVRQENLRLIGKMEESLRREFSAGVSDLKSFANQRLETLEGFYRNTQFTLILGVVAIIISMWAPFLLNLR